MSIIPTHKHEQILKDAAHIKSQLDNNIVDFKTISNFVSFILDTKPLTKSLSKEDVQEMFKKFLKVVFQMIKPINIFGVTMRDYHLMNWKKF